MKSIIFLLMIAFTAFAAESPQQNTNAPTQKVVSLWDLMITFSASSAKLPLKKTNATPHKVVSPWDFKTLLATSSECIGPGDPRYDKLIADGWEMFGYGKQPAWVGGADRPERCQTFFRRKKR